MSGSFVYLVGYAVSLPIMFKLMERDCKSYGRKISLNDAYVTTMSALAWPATLPISMLYLHSSSSSENLK
jgi:hypothetical protein